MTAHIVVDALDPERPATLSPATLEGVLRGALGFKGLIISDDLEMKAISGHLGVPDAACQAIAAGCDALLICSQPELCQQAHAALVERAEREPAFAARLRAAAQRNLDARRTRGHRPEPAASIAARLHELGDRPLEDRLAGSLA
jgi:beta-N-acetylhexosaminidase